MNFSEFFSRYLLIENASLFGPVYHGGFWNGQTPIKTTGRGALGVGAYFTTNLDRAREYSRDGASYNDEGGGRNVVECYLDIHKPLQINLDNRYDPCVLLLTMLGMKQAAAVKMVEKAYDQHGYVGKQIAARAIPQGYDAIIQTNTAGDREVVIWNAALVKSAKLV